MTVHIAGDALAIGVGAFFGAMSRHHAGRVASEWIATDPARLGHLSGWHTAGINIGGSFILGGISGTPAVATAVMSKPASSPSSWSAGLSPRQRLLLGVGFCGSFTTFSTYSVDVVTWLAKGETTKAVSYVMTNNVGGIVAAAAGLVIAKKIFGKL